MDDIPKIQLSRPMVSGTEPIAPPIAPVIADQPIVPVVAQGKRWVILPIVGAVLLLIVGGGLFWAFSNIIVWNDDTQIEEKQHVAFIPLTPPAKLGDGTVVQGATSVALGAVKGRITATLSKEKGLPFTEGSIRLYNSSGKLIKETKVDAKGLVIFDEIPAGSYTVEGGKYGEKRAVRKQIVLSEGEITDVALSIFLDTNVTVTVNVKDPGGSPMAGQAFTLRKLRSSEPPLDFDVTTNGSGTFTKSGISPDESWKLLLGGEEAASFAVAPTGQNQTINVTAKSN